MIRKRSGLVGAGIALALAAGAGVAQADSVVPVAGVSANTLADTVLGTGVTRVGNATFTGDPAAAGAFSTLTNAAGPTGLGVVREGIALSSGRVADMVGPNNFDDTTTHFDRPGDAALNALAGFATRDAAVLEFDFTIDGLNGGTADIFFNFAFASEEYNEYGNTPFNDVFGLFVDGVNRALLPGSATPVAINTVNGGNPLGVNAQNPHLYYNNDPSDIVPAFNIEYDGITHVFQAQAMGLDDGVHHIKFAIADASDSILDSTVFIQGNTLSVHPTPTNVVPLPAAAFLGLPVLAWVIHRRRVA